ncbi:hypothetical protein Agub_g5929 [Astrephomene gubernaculifera]|uniref:Amine oxidase domain-containing protein n=1 Tax=Astrephomene gubernaculifera TaxID=47775 RepID=A0AAD3DMJ7_9CHLO|nr:hypothetical protein Agub_g5929 [Astrephomene gubernaculifera]
MELPQFSNAVNTSRGRLHGAEETATDVIVIGAGISGLACAATLRNAGLRVVVLEARERIGGRIHTVPLAEGNGRPTWAVDLGGAWVHGIGSSGAPNHLYSLACELQLGCLPTDYSDAAVYTAEGVRLAAGTVADIENLYHVFEQHLHTLLHSPDPALALMPIQTALEAFASARRLSPAQRAHLAFAVSNHMEHYWAGEATHMGVAALDEEVLPGGDVVLARGYAGIVERLAVGLDVRLGHEVLAVQYGGGTEDGGGGGVKPGDRSSGRGGQQQQQQPAAGVVVTARMGGSSLPTPAGAAAAAAAAAPSSSSGGAVMRLTARAAVVTLPVGVLRSGAVCFQPALAQADPRKAAAVRQLGTAVYNKVIMLFDPADVFWDDTAFIYRIPGPCEAGRWSYFLNLHKVTGAPILIAFNLGEAAAALEALGDEETLGGAMRALAGLYGSSRVRRPRQTVVTRWGSDPYSRMSYTYIPAGLTSAAFDDVARPILGSLFFAGEAAHRRHYGTAHGAYESGLLAASAVVRELALKQQWQWQLASRRLLQQQQQQQRPRSSRALRAAQRPTGQRVAATGKVPARTVEATAAAAASPVGACHAGNQDGLAGSGAAELAVVLHGAMEAGKDELVSGFHLHEGRAMGAGGHRGSGGECGEEGGGQQAGAVGEVAGVTGLSEGGTGGKEGEGRAGVGEVPDAAPLPLSKL